MKRYRSALFPEFGEETERSAEKTKKLLEKEFNRGPMQVQALDYSTRRKKKKRR